MTSKNKEFGMLIVGLGGNNGVTQIAGLLANQKDLEWETATGKVKANYYGCITQLPTKGGKGGYRERYSLAHANRGAIGGWDIRSSPLGDALYASHVLEYDLVRQVRATMNQEIKIMPGVWSPSFIGESQHATAIHVAKTENHKQSLEVLRRDIRSFKADNDITGHTTVIWSASVERPCEKDFNMAEQLLSAIEANDPEVSPSLLYATAACLEGCSFVNGGSQNTLCPALAELGAKHGAYVLGTDFKAGQTKFKTAAVEYIRALGLAPTVIASSNHLGNNDMLNLTSKKTLDAKMRVKSDIFAGWEEHIDHQVRVMYTPFIGDEKRDIVEYTSLAVWCDYFARKGVYPEHAAMATAYLFKVPEGAAKGVDPGFFHQMGLLEKVLEATISFSSTKALKTNGDALLGSIVCVGLSCLDLMLVGASGQGEAFGAINTFQHQVFCPGGSAPQTSLALAELGLPRVGLLTKMGVDVHGDELLRQLKMAGVDTSLVIRHPEQSTSLAVLPILASTGARGCFVNLQANDSFTPSEALAALEGQQHVAGVHFGYPHLMKNFQGKGLKTFLEGVGPALKQEGIAPLVSMDLNGVTTANKGPEVLAEGLPFVDVLHLNQDEAGLLASIDLTGSPPPLANLKQAASKLLEGGVAVVAITLGEAGAYVAVTSEANRIKPQSRLVHQASKWIGQDLILPPYLLTAGAEVNTNGAGDAFIGGLVAAMLTPSPLTLDQATKFALLVARERVDSIRRTAKVKATFYDLLKKALQ